MWRPSIISRLFGRRYSTNARILALALGSNVGDRVANIEGALSFLEQKSDIKIVDTSFLYETLPMYVHDQPKFINAACLISTSLEPQALINLLKDAENHQGRTPTIRNGPRTVDLDVLFDDNKVYTIKDVPERSLNVPHPRIHEREFVLRPLADMIPNFQHPVLKSTISTLLSRLSADSSMRKIINFSALDLDDGIEPAIWRRGEKTYLMATLNTTPDSFSDGGENNNIVAATQYSLQAQAAGADIVDVGGFSTRPGSTTISEQDELSRTVPYIIALRKAGLRLPISVDTFRARVAQDCIEAGANCINDVYGLTGPHAGVAGTTPQDMIEDDSGVPVSDANAMLKVAVRSKLPVIIMHSRGPANANKDYSSLSGVSEGVRTELGLRVARALKAGVRRWNIILDPGVGFSKSVEDNLQLVREHAHLTIFDPSSQNVEYSLPSSPALHLANFATLVGTSRKRYLGQVIGHADSLKDAQSRDWGTAAAITALVQQKVDIVRVHHVQGMQDVVKVADAIWRNK